MVTAFMAVHPGCAGQSRSATASPPPTDLNESTGLPESSQILHDRYVLLGTYTSARERSSADENTLITADALMEEVEVLLLLEEYEEAVLFWEQAMDLLELPDRDMTP